MVTGGIRAAHACTVVEVGQATRTALAFGLTDAEVRRRLERDGPNVLPGGASRALWRIVIDQFRSPLIYVLMAAALATLVIGHPVDALVIAGVLLVNAVIGFAQEARASSVLDALALSLIHI